MAYDDKLAGRIRELLSRRKGLVEKKMFGGIAFMLRDHMCCGVHQEHLIVRVGPDQYETLLKEPHARPMDITGRPLKGFLFIGPGGYRTDKRLAEWVGYAIEFVATLPAKWHSTNPPHRKQGR
jgi:TfoX/Sxy family transcriptional regulator of competence genes